MTLLVPTLDVAPAANQQTEVSINIIDLGGLRLRRADCGYRDNNRFNMKPIISYYIIMGWTPGGSSREGLCLWHQYCGI